MEKTQDEKELLANSITKAIAYTENGGAPDLNNPKAGKTGEMASIFQFTPNTWKLYSKQVFGKEMPINADNETYVVNEKVKKWIDEGHNAQEIASMWNAGESKKDAYKQNWKGVNKKYGVKYDTPKYAKTVQKYATEFYKNKVSNIDLSGKALTTGAIASNLTDPLSKVLSVITATKKASVASTPIKNNALNPNTGLIQQAINQKKS